MKDNLPSLTGLRFPAALAVVIYHYSQAVHGFSLLPGFIVNAILCGPTAVPFFFILSGFLLAHRYPKVERVQRFWLSRFARLYPAYILSFLLFAPIAFQKYIHAVHRPDIFFASGLLNLVMLQSWTPLAQSWNGPSWSLSVEAFFYFLFPFIITKLINKPLIWIATVGTLVFASIGLAFGMGFISEPVWRSYLEDSPLLWTPLFLLGIATASILPSWKARVSPRANQFLLAGASLCLFLSAGFCPARFRTGLISGGAAGLLVILLLASATGDRLIDRILGNKLFIRLGSASYILYIIQAPAWHMFRITSNLLLRRPAMDLTVSVGQFLVFLPLLMCLSLVVQRLFENPLHQWILLRGNAFFNTGASRKQSLPVGEVAPKRVLSSATVTEKLSSADLVSPAVNET